MQPSEKAARFMEHLAAHDAHGYSQPRRDGDGWQESVDLGDGKPVLFHRDYDCSRAVIDAYAAQGINTGGASYTLDMWKLCEGGAFESVRLDNLKRGDIVNTTKNRHAVMYLGNGKIAEALASETWGVDGEPGDQTGTEVRITDWYDDDWTAAYRCLINEREGWHKIGPLWYYYEDNKPVCDRWVEGEAGTKYAGLWYYLGSDGAMATGWKKIGGDWYYFGGNGARGHDRPVEWSGHGWCWLGSDGKCIRYGNVQIDDWLLK